MHSFAQHCQFSKSAQKLDLASFFTDKNSKSRGIIGRTVRGSRIMSSRVPVWLLAGHFPPSSATQKSNLPWYFFRRSDVQISEWDTAKTGTKRQTNTLPSWQIRALRKKISVHCIKGYNNWDTGWLSELYTNNYRERRKVLPTRNPMVEEQ